MFKTILVPLDGSPLSESVLPYVKQLSRDLKADIQIVKVVEPSIEEAKKYIKGDFSSQVSAGAKRESNRYFEKMRDYLKSPGIHINSQLLKGIPVVEILSEARKNPNTLIAMSTHGRSGVRRWLIGSVADKVVRESTIPLLLIRPKERSPIGPDPVLKSVIVPLDESKFSEQALPNVAYLAQALNLRVILTRVTPSELDYSRWGGDYGSEPFSAASLSDIARSVDEGAIDYMKSVSQKLTKQKVGPIEYRLFHGDPAGAIIDLSSATPDSFVVMTTRGRTGFSRSVLGSVADRVVRNCGEPVLLIRV